MKLFILGETFLLSETLKKKHSQWAVPFVGDNDKYQFLRTALFARNINTKFCYFRLSNK